MRQLLVAVLAMLLVAGCASARMPGSAPATTATPAAAKAEPGRPLRQVLPNGLRLIMQDHRGGDVVAVYLYVGVGVRYETAEGLANAYGLAETTWDLDAEPNYVNRLRRVTREQMRDAARTYLSRTDYAQVAFVPRTQ